MSPKTTPMAPSASAACDARRSGNEAISDPGVGADVTGALAGFDLAAQVRYVRAQDAGVVGVAGPPDLDQQRAVGHQAPAVAQQDPEQVVLDRRQVHLLPVAPDHARGKV